MEALILVVLLGLLIAVLAMLSGMRRAIWRLEENQETARKQRNRLFDLMQGSTIETPAEPASEEPAVSPPQKTTATKPAPAMAAM